MNWYQKRMESASANDIYYVAWLVVYRDYPMWMALQAGLESFTCRSQQGEKAWKKIAATMSPQEMARFTATAQGATCYRAGYYGNPAHA